MTTKGIIKENTYVRYVLFEKCPMRVRIAYKDSNECDYWYRYCYGEIFEVIEIKDCYKNTRDFRVIIGERDGAFIARNDCKILSGI